MRLLYICFITGALLAPFSSANGQEESVLGLSSPVGLRLFRRGLGNTSLLDPGRFSVHQRYSLMFISDGEKSSLSGLYLSTFRYRFSVPLSLRVDLGYIQTSSLQGLGSPGARGRVL